MNVSSVKNLNGETFSAVQDATLTDVVQSNSASWSQGGGNPEVESYVQTNSGTIDETITSYQTNSSTYMVEPNLEYNAVNEISAYNGSAIAQYGAEKQWLIHDDTIVSISNSAQYAFGCNISAIAQLLGVDETVLFSGDDIQVTASKSVDLNDNWRNYNRIKINYMHSFGPSDTTHGGNNHEEISVLTNDEGFTLGVPGVYTDAGTIFFDRNSFGFTSANPNKMYINAFGSRLGFTSAGGWTTTNARGVKNIKVIGIGRKA